MDAKKIRIAYPNEEAIDISLSLTPAAHLYVVILRGLQTVKHDVDHANLTLNQLQKLIEDNPLGPLVNQYRAEIQKIRSEIQIAVNAHNEGAGFFNELQKIIQELEKPPDNKPKIIIPDWRH